MFTINFQGCFFRDSSERNTIYSNNFATNSNQNSSTEIPWNFHRDSVSVEVSLWFLGLRFEYSDNDDFAYKHKPSSQADVRKSSLDDRKNMFLFLVLLIFEIFTKWSFVAFAKLDAGFLDIKKIE